MRASARRVAVLRGGSSREHGVSLLSGNAVVRALRERGHDVVDVRIDPDGAWRFDDAAPITRAHGLLALSGEGSLDPIDVVFIALHGAWGEDGTLQGTLKTLGLPYTGSGVLASALAMDKERTKEVLAHHGVATPAWVAVEARAWSTDRDGVLGAAADLTAPLVVKPGREGSSFGISLVATTKELPAALDVALDSPGARALVEERVVGTEVTCAVLGNHNDPLRTLPIVEIVPRDGAMFDFEAKYQGASEEICPARISEAAARRVSAAAQLAHELLGCDGLSRSDFFIDADDNAWFLETNTVPGMTRESLSPRAAAAAGLTFEDLCEELVRLALKRTE